MNTNTRVFIDDVKIRMGKQDIEHKLPMRVCRLTARCAGARV
ncbi:protein of unknown function [Vibrio tapetis subsp. tapetis]|uniref:Uncharacterized protein n=1 Tax=Vibrio tapetis subsp. tapetis TaxID=1671868 RepID=A0A2N8ZAA4_9VIBR|nr:protein of unknown function [Vibrio tapetis subsp. tapetis]